MPSSSIQSMKQRTFLKPTNEAEFYRELKSEVHERLGRTKKQLGPNFWFYLKAGNWILLSWGTYLLILFGIIPSNLALYAAMLATLAGLLFGFSIGHEASHRLLSRRPLVNHIAHYLSFLTIGVDPLLWGLRHIRSHHIFPNVDGSDIDIDKNPLLRLSPAHPWEAKHQFQHIYAPIAYSLALAHSVFYGDWVYLVSKEYEWMRRGVSLPVLWISFVLFKLAHFSLLIIIPCLFLDYSCWTIIGSYFLCGAISSLVFIVMLVGTHFFEEAAYPQSNAAGMLPTSWAVHNLSTSCDWNPNSKFARFISGGANCHAANHLFPNICHIHYGKITPIIRSVTEKYGLMYHERTLLEMIYSHFRHLKQLSIKPGSISD
jgi:linoleoyl-CoA desaturase